MERVKTGLDKLIEEDFRRIRGRSIGIVANQTSTTNELKHIVEEAKRKGRCKVEVVFTPEHGFRSAIGEGEKIYGEKYDEEYNVKIYSLYGETYKPPRIIMEKLETLVFDLQDVGVRWYTYISTLYYCLEACGETETPIIILDRPNPITGEIIEGTMLESKYKSFIGIAEIPIRYGLTIGELSTFLNEKYGLNAPLQVIAMENWRRDLWFDETGLIWIPPSPNMPTINSASIYPGTGLIEGTNISEGRGTPLPFQLVGAPWMNSRKTSEELNRIGLNGVKFRSTIFKPTTSKYKDQYCRGIQVHITNRLEARPFQIGIHILSAIKRLHPKKFKWIKRKERYIIDLLTGTDKLRKKLDEGEDPWIIIDELEGPLEDYAYKKQNYHLYI
ncbi:MAG: DUF1343 domain-containing protein [archaeon GB-1867-097]|nr:DUF1343 domain-containing protein [Candidatus Culexmicrobium thermophilum]MCS7384138.1 DUF1343 domain-containing protein [Candidatus Culexmicrobium thermophilum]